MDAANMLKPMLARGELRMVGATTLAEYRRIERDGALARRFSPVTVEEPTVEETVEILRGLRAAYEEHHGVADRPTRRSSPPRGCRTATSPSTTCPTRRSTWSTRPPRSVRLRTRRRATSAAAAAASSTSSPPRSRPRSTPRSTRTPAELKAARSTALEERLARATAAATPDARRRRDRGRGRRSPPAPASRWASWSPASCERLQELEDDLHQRVIGQDEAVELVADTVRRARVGLSEGDRAAGHVPVPRPDRRRQDRAGQGAGRAAVRHRAGARPDRHVRVPRAAHRRAADRLAARLRRLRRRRPADRAGAPAARTRWSCSTRSRRRTRRCGTCCCSCMDDGRLTDGEGRTVDFTNTVVVMTSNLGAGKAKRGVGFTAAEPALATTSACCAAAQRGLPARVPQPDRRDRHASGRSTPAQVERIAELRGRPRRPSGCATSAASSSRSSRRSSPAWPATASTRSSAPGRSSATSGARWRRS